MSRKKKYWQLLEKALYAALAAVDSYNKTLFPYKQEAFAILMTNAWELLLKAKWVQKHKNNYKSIFVRIKNRRYKRNRSGNEMTYGLTYLLDKMREQKEIHENVYNNLLSLIEIRDNAVHLYISPHLRERIHSIVIANTRNFYLLTEQWFGKEPAKFLENVIVQPLTFIPPDNESFQGIKSEERLFRYLQRLSASQQDNSEGFWVAAEVQLKFVKSKEQGNALPVRITPNDPNAVRMQLTERQWQEKYPWTYQELTDKLKSRYEDFKQNRQFHKLRKQIEPDPSQCNPEACYSKYCRIRFLDPKHPDKSQKKKFYSPAVLEHFDRFYTKREK